MRASARNVIAIRKHVVAVKGIIFDALHVPLDALTDRFSQKDFGISSRPFLFFLSLSLFAVDRVHRPRVPKRSREGDQYYSLWPKNRRTTNKLRWFHHVPICQNRDRAICTKKKKKLRKEFLLLLYGIVAVRVLAVRFEVDERERDREESWWWKTGGV